MIKIKFEDGEIIVGQSYRDVVQKMMDNPWVQEESIDEYMQAVAHRTNILPGERIKYQGEEEFISELHRIGIIGSIKQS